MILHTTVLSFTAAAASSAWTLRHSWGEEGGGFLGAYGSQEIELRLSLTFATIEAYQYPLPQPLYVQAVRLQAALLGGHCRALRPLRAFLLLTPANMENSFTSRPLSGGIKEKIEDKLVQFALFNAKALALFTLYFLLIAYASKIVHAEGLRFGEGVTPEQLVIRTSPPRNVSTKEIPVATKPVAKAPVIGSTLGYDLDKLAKAVALHETGDCTAKLGAATVNNCFGIMAWSNGQRYFKRYKTKEDSYADFKRIWSSYYQKFPDLKLAKRYSGNDRPYQWLANVKHFYASL